MRYIHLIFLSVLTTLLCVVGAQAQAQIRVVASIKPLQLIAMAVTDGISEPAVVLDSSQDPHHPSLRPSQRRALDQAQVFLWTGPQMETGLESVLPVLEAQIITVLDLPDLNLHQIGNVTDPHVWLDTRNAILIAERLASVLMMLDPDNGVTYQTNLESFRTELQRLEQSMRDELQPDGFPPFAVYHNGYQYFERQFGLVHVASFTSNEEVQPGIRQVLAVKQQLEDKQVGCIVVGPSQNTEFLDNQLGIAGMQYVSIDLLAHDTALARDGYNRFMENLADKFNSCRRQ